MRLRRTVWCIALVAFVSPSFAHIFAPSLFAVREHVAGRLDVEWRAPITKAPGVDLRPVLPPGCSPLGDPVTKLFESASSTTWQVECEPPGLIGKRFTVAGLTESPADVMMRVELADGRSFRTILRESDPAFVVPEIETRTDVFASYLILGVEHILSGFDHLLFVFGLVLLIRGRRLFWTLTAFTAGHSVTLALAVLGIVQFPQGLAELAIAATIFALAVELTRDHDSGTLLRRHPEAMAAPFGLLHGLGFAGALSEIGLPPGEVPLSLFSFNVGIEVGQLAFVAIVLVFERAVRPIRTPWPKPLRIAPAYFIGTLAAFWLFSRL